MSPTGVSARPVARTAGGRRRWPVAGLADVTLVVDAVVHACPPLQREHDQLRLALHEAIVNALRHGEGRVRVGCRVGVDRVEVTVRDEGDGAATGRVPPAPPTELLDDSGRGWTLLAASCDEVTVWGLQPRGTVVALRYVRARVSPPGTP